MPWAQVEAPAALAPAAAAAGLGSGAKRKRRQAAPPEACPFCAHTYTVRDGLSSKLDAEGNRLHLRRCQCRWGVDWAGQRLAMGRVGTSWEGGAA